MTSEPVSVVEKEFDNLAIEYESNRLSGWYQAHADEVLKHCLDLKEGDILDVGCGTGHFLRLYLKNKPHVRALGIDISSNMIAQAKERAYEAGLDNLKFVQANWENLNLDTLKDYNFKAIFCANTFHYFTTPQTATDRLFEQLADGGTLYIVERNKARSPLTAFWGFLHNFFIKDQVVFYKKAALINFFRTAGFKHVKLLSSIKKYFWKKKLFTSIVLIEGKK